MEDLENKPDCCCARPGAAPETCPVCGKHGRRVTGVTLDHQLAPAHRARLGETAGFCANPACEAVYFDGAAIVRKGETLLPVTQKDPGDDVPVCYCFGIRRSDLRRDLAATGTTAIPERISREIKEGRCDCERKNPQGICCLGTVSAEIGKIRTEKSERRIKS